MKYSERIPVLTKEIPNDGRYLSNYECKLIRSYGYSCSVNYYIQRAYDSPFDGILYYPGKTGGLIHAEIYVTTK